MKPLRLFLVNVGLRTFSNFWVVPPMGVLALAAYLRQKFPLEIRVVNQRLENWTAEQIARQAGEFGADIVGLSTLTTTACLLPEITSKIRAALPEAFVVLGGPHVSAAGGLVLEGIDADAAVSGEGERPFELLIRAKYEGDGALDAVPGLIWRDKDGAVVQNPGGPLFVEDIDSLPMPAYDLIDLPAYWHHKTIVPMLYRRYAALVTTRGCPYHCIWCHNIFGKKVRMHSPERIVEEMTFLNTKYGVNDFEILDDTFNFDGRHVIDFCELLHRRNLKFKWSIPNGVRGDILTPEVIDAMAGAGLFMCLFALDSGSPRIQKYTRKNLNIPRFLENCKLVADHRIFIHANFMLGFPTETEEEIRQTIDTACNPNFHTASFFIVTPYPGTPLYDIVKKEHPEKLTKFEFGMRNSMTVRANLTDLPDEVLYGYQRQASRRFFMNPRRIARIIRDHPQRIALPAYVPLLCYRALAGALGRGK